MEMTRIQLKWEAPSSERIQKCSIWRFFFKTLDENLMKNIRILTNFKESCRNLREFPKISLRLFTFKILIHDVVATFDHRWRWSQYLKESPKNLLNSSRHPQWSAKNKSNRILHKSHLKNPKEYQIRMPKESKESQQVAPRDPPTDSQHSWIRW